MAIISGNGAGSAGLLKLHAALRSDACTLHCLAVDGAPTHRLLRMCMVHYPSRHYPLHYPSLKRLVVTRWGENKLISPFQENTRITKIEFRMYKVMTHCPTMLSMSFIDRHF